jgi:hypothetical protein
MGNPTQRSEHIKDAADFFTAVANGTLPALSFVKPDGLIDGSSATSKLDLFEAGCQFRLGPSRRGFVSLPKLGRGAYGILSGLKREPHGETALLLGKDSSQIGTSPYSSHHISTMAPSPKHSRNL